MKSESVETTVRKLNPQRIATSTVAKFDAWRQAVLDQVERIERNRTANHPLGKRLRNMSSFLAEELADISRVEGRKVFVQAGRFHWLLVRLLQRQESMKAQLAPDDPFVRELDPKLRRRIKAGWDAVPFPESFNRLIDRLNLRMQAARRKLPPPRHKKAGSGRSGP